MSNEVIGYGKSPKGSVVHAILDGRLGLCDRRKLTGLVVDKEATPSMVSCAKCKRYKVVKDAQPVTGLPTMAAKADKKPEPKPEPKPKPKPKAEPKPKVRKVEEYDFVSQKTKGDKFSIYHRPSKRKFFESLPGEVVDNAVAGMNDIEIRWQNAEDPVPAGFVGALRKALKEAYEKADITPPKGILDVDQPKKKTRRREPKTTTRKFEKGDELDLNGVPMVYDGKKWQKKKAEKPKRVIRRRPPKEKKAEKRVIRRRKKPAAENEKSTRKIKRREKPEAEKPKRKIRRRKKPAAEDLNRFGMKKDMPPAAIVEYMEGDGATFDELVEMLMDLFDLPERRAKAKIKGIVNKLARRKGAKICMILASEEGLDRLMFID